MSDYRDIEKEAFENGILLDKCGLIERHYDFGSYQDFCGMEPQEILENMRKAGCPCSGGGDDEDRTLIITTFKDDVKTAETRKVYKVGSEVNIIVPEIDGCTFINWELLDESGTDTEITFEMPDIDGLTLKLYYEIESFSVSFVNEDGTELQKEILKYGVTPIYHSETPTKEPDQQYTYTWNGWTPDIVPVTKDVTYTATYTETVNKYTVTWLVSGVSENVEYEYGATPTHADPASSHTEQYDYTFERWDPAIVAVTGNVTYTAIFAEHLNSYSIVINNSADTMNITVNGVEYDPSDVYPYGTDVEIVAEFKDEYKPQYHFENSGDTWETELTISGENVITLPNTELDTYLITWLNDEEVLSRYYNWTDTHNGESVHGKEDMWNAKEARPADANLDVLKDEQGHFILDEYGKYIYNEDCERCWLGACHAVNANYPWAVVELPAPFSGKIKFEYKDGTVVYPWGEHVVDRPNGYGVASIAEELNKPELQMHYNADGSVSGDVTVHESDLIVTLIDPEGNETFATWRLIKDEASWLAAAQSNLLYQEELAYGTIPVYSGATPSKPASVALSYVFNGWNPEVTAVTGDATYKATYTETVNEYTVTWVISGESTEETLAYGTTPTHADPETVHTPEYDYTFDGWDPEIGKVTSNVTYEAQFEAHKNSYEIIFRNENGTELQRSEVEYGETPEYLGETPTKEATPQYTYTFNGWDSEIVPVTADTTYTATFSATVNEYTISWLMDDGSLIDTTSVAYGNIPTHTNPVKPADSGYTYSFIEWNPTIVEVTGNATYTAQFSATPKQYTVTLSGDPLQVTLSGSGTYDYGTVVEISATPVGEYVFDRWSDDVTASTRQITVTGDVTLTAYVKEETPALAYWGEVNAKEFDELGKNIQLSQLQNSLSGSTSVAGKNGAEVDINGTTGNTYAYVVTSADAQEFRTYFNADPCTETICLNYQNYLNNTDKYFLYIIPSHYLSNDKKVFVHDSVGPKVKTVDDSNYLIDGTPYTVVKLALEREALIIDDDENEYPINETYWGSDVASEKTTGTVLNKIVNITIQNKI